MFTQHKGLLPELVQTDGFNNQNKRIDKSFVFFKHPLALLELQGWSAEASVTPWICCVLVFGWQWPSDHWVKIDIFTYLLKQISWGVQLGNAVNTLKMYKNGIKHISLKYSKVRFHSDWQSN